MRIMSGLCVLLGGVLLSAQALAETEVERYFGELTTLKAEFAQTVYDEQGRSLERSSGTMYMQRPLRFRWDYRTPHQQLIVADGESLWLYDKGLEQVTVQPLDDTLGATPLALLSGERPLGDVFGIRSLPSSGPLQWYRLSPLDADATEVSVLRLAFSEGELQVLEIEDVFQRRTRLALVDVERDALLDDAVFRFEPPPGVDVVGAY